MHRFDGLILISLQPEATEQNVEQTPIEPNPELNDEEMPTKTRFSGRKNFADFFDSTTQMIETEVMKFGTHFLLYILILIFLFLFLHSIDRHRRNQHPVFGAV